MGPDGLCKHRHKIIQWFLKINAQNDKGKSKVQLRVALISLNQITWLLIIPSLKFIVHWVFSISFKYFSFHAILAPPPSLHSTIVQDSLKIVEYYESNNQFWIIIFNN